MYQDKSGNPGREREGLSVPTLRPAKHQKEKLKCLLNSTQRKTFFRLRGFHFHRVKTKISGRQKKGEKLPAKNLVILAPSFQGHLNSIKKQFK
jgi:hypothetical protein